METSENKACIFSFSPHLLYFLLSVTQISFSCIIENRLIQTTYPLSCSDRKDEGFYGEWPTQWSGLHGENTDC